MKKLGIFLRWCLVLYILGAVILYVLQDAILFRPKPLENNFEDTFSLPHQYLRIPLTATDTLSILKIYSLLPLKKGSVIYFHGNRDNVQRYIPFAGIFTRAGYDVYMPDYPGYGRSTGIISEASLYAQAMRVYEEASANSSGDSIIIYGKSLGSGIAAYLASQKPSRMLILETPYYDVSGIFGAYAFMYPVHQLVKYKIPTWKYVQQVKEQVIIFAGEADGVIRFSENKKLEPLLKPQDAFYSIPGAGHNEVNLSPEYLFKMDSLLRL
ncbi:MAG: alpha/beta fold hydrolase [Ferruginibacter sp.]